MNDVDAGEPSSFGIKKIVACKIEDGRQMFKVKWEPTWEPAENLASCQHLIDKFWSYVDNVKTSDELAQQHRKRMRLDYPNIPNFDRLSEDNKADVQRLIARTASTHPLISPSDTLTLQSNQQSNFMGMPQDQSPVKQNFSQNSTGMTQSFNPPPPHQLKATPTKVENNEALDIKSSPSANSKAALNNASLKYLENFNNPYVKIVIVCKICNKEQPSKFAGNWRQHYMTHSEKKPHQCPHCPKTFIRADQMRKHVQGKHGGSGGGSGGGGGGGGGGSNTMMSVKEEPMGNHYIKTENFHY